MYEAVECTRGIRKLTCSASYFQLKCVHSATKQCSNAHIAKCPVINTEKPRVPRPFAQKVFCSSITPDCTMKSRFEVDAQCDILRPTTNSQVQCRRSILFWWYLNVQHIKPTCTHMVPKFTLRAKFSVNNTTAGTNFHNATLHCLT